MPVKKTTELNAGVAAAVDAADATVMKDPNVITLSNGVVVKVKPLPQLYIQSLSMQFPEPEVPKIKYKDEEDDKVRYEYNPNDPGYVRARRDWMMNIVAASNKVVLLRGLDILSFPEGFVPFDADEEFYEEQELFGFKLRDKSRSERYLHWLEYRVVATLKDFEDIEKAIEALSGSPSEEVIKNAMDSFQG